MGNTIELEYKGSQWWTTEQLRAPYDDWRVRVRHAPNGQRQPEIVAVVIEPLVARQGAGMTGAVLRAVKLDGHSRYAAEGIGRMARALRLDSRFAAMLQDWKPAARPKARTGTAGRPRKWTDAQLCRAAIVYDDAARGGLSVYAAIMRELRVSDRTANGIVNAARRALFLPARGRGQSAVPLTPENRRQLEQRFKEFGSREVRAPKSPRGK